MDRIIRYYLDLVRLQRVKHLIKILYRNHNSENAIDIMLQRATERRGRMVNTPASYSGFPGFKSRPGDRLS
jgi:hypothetical protein